MEQYIDLEGRESAIEWTTDSAGTDVGWTLIFQPDYPEVDLDLGTPMAQGASGYRIVSVYGSEGAASVGVDDGGDSVSGATSSYLTEYMCFT